MNLTRKQLAQMIEAGADRLGISGSVAIIRQINNL